MTSKHAFAQKDPPPPQDMVLLFLLTWDSILVPVFLILGAVSVLVLEPTFKFGQFQFPVLGDL
jgi:hypothetical protein